MKRVLIWFWKFVGFFGCSNFEETLRTQRKNRFAVHQTLWALWVLYIYHYF
jgi:hypothetical protein